MVLRRCAEANAENISHLWKMPAWLSGGEPRIGEGAGPYEFSGGLPPLAPSVKDQRSMPLFGEG